MIDGWYRRSIRRELEELQDSSGNQGAKRQPTGNSKISEIGATPAAVRTGRGWFSDRNIYLVCGGPVLDEGKKRMKNTNGLLI